ncbi:MAG TPA: electron transfer flavoprotein subunit beta [candidate division Zixibacteria bacterium]|nr:electron transfer flavoprotein subunit beta [candidate division Zixibacteria bacterium]HBZ01860.1 electron transfer flavoprotein subunit beta [candidate division Zixibacteria bacterium]
MKIAVLIKQIPQLSEVTFGADGPQWPEGALIINPFDEYAVEEALRIKERIGGTAVTISFGKSSAENVLRDTLALGMDEACLIESDKFSYVDPQMSAQVLAAAIKKIGDIDLVLCGKQASDDDSALVASAVAGYLDWPQVGFVKKFDTIVGGKLVAWRTTDSGYDVVESSLPAVCSVVKEINEPRLPSLKGKMKAKKMEIKKLSPSELGVEMSSPINIKAIDAPKARPQGEMITGETDEIIETLIQKLKADQLI